MFDEDKTKENLIRELTNLRRRLVELELSEIRQREVLRDLRESQERYRLLVESSSDFIWEVDASGIYTYVSPKIKDLLGYEPEEIIGKTPFDLMPAYEAERVARLFKDIIESQKPFQELENTNLHKDGHHVVLDTSGVPIFDTNGNLSGYRGIDRDISERKKIEEAMKHTKEFSDNVIDSSLDCIVISDRRGYVNKVNRFFLELLGYKEEEVVGKHIAEFAPPEAGTYELVTGEWVEIKQEFYDNQLAMIAVLIEEGKVFNWEAYYIRKDKKLIPIEQNIVYLYNRQGEKYGSVGISRNITDRMKAEKTIIEARDFLENIIESSLDSIVVVDKRGLLSRVNSAFSQLLGFSKAEVIGKHMSEFSPTSTGTYECTTGELIQINEDFCNYLESNMLLFKEKGRMKNAISYLLRKDNKIVPVEGNMVYLLDKEGKRIGAVAITRDITERRKAEIEIQKAKDYLENMFMTSVDGVIIADAEGKIAAVNKAIEKMFCCSSDQLVGKHTMEIGFDKEKDNASGRIVIGKLLKEGTIFGVERTWKKSDGGFIVVEMNVALIKDNEGNMTGSVASIRDITERKRTEKKLDEYQNQLRSMSSQLTLTEEKERRRIATDLHDRIGQALAIAKIKLGSLRESASAVGLDGDVDGIRELIEQTIEDTRSLIFDLCPPVLYELGFEKALEWLVEEIQREHGIKTLFVNDHKPKPMDDDVCILVYQTVRELLVNIIKHSQAQNASVCFKKNRKNICIDVEDDGVGFDVDKIQNHVDRKGGFGLFRIRERFRYLGGVVKIESESSRGTRVSLAIPMKKNGKSKKGGIK